MWVRIEVLSGTGPVADGDAADQRLEVRGDLTQLRVAVPFLSVMGTSESIQTGAHIPGAVRAIRTGVQVIRNPVTAPWLLAIDTTSLTEREFNYGRDRNVVATGAVFRPRN
jgi:hypothetical protein